MINTLQIIVLTDLFALDVPMNASLVMQLILKMCSLEFIDTSIVQEFAFRFRQTSAFQTKTNAEEETYSKFEEAGFETAIFFELLGPMLFIVLAFALLALLRQLCNLVVGKVSKDGCLRRKLRK